jgi:hypothetical protein
MVIGRRRSIMLLTVTGWREFQHYRNRTPPWIKLHRHLLDDMAWHGLPDAAKALAPMLWLLASESKDGRIDTTVEHLAFRLRTDRERVDSGLRPLIEAGFVACVQDAGAESEGEAESESESEPQKRKGPEADASASSQRTVTDLVFGQGLHWLMRAAARDERQCRGLLGKWRRELGADEALIALLGRAQREGVIEPVAWIEKAIAAHRVEHSPKPNKGWN